MAPRLVLDRSEDLSGLAVTFVAAIRLSILLTELFGIVAAERPRRLLG